MEIKILTEGDDLASRIAQMFENVIHQGHGSLALIFLIGIIFGGIIQYTRVDKFEKIAGFSMLKDTIVPKIEMFDEADLQQLPDDQRPDKIENLH